MENNAVEAQNLEEGMEISINGYITIVELIQTVDEHTTITDINGYTFKINKARWIKVWS